MMRQKGVLSATFIGPKELDFRHPDLITNMLRGLNGVRFVNTCLGNGCLVAISTIANCPMAVVIDGQLQTPENLAAPPQPPVYAVRIDRLIAADGYHGHRGLRPRRQHADQPAS